MDKRQLMAIVLGIALLAVPATAGDKYLYGTTDLAATISGSNQFAPGADTTLTVKIENSGLNSFKIVQSTIISQDDLPNTAKLIKATLEPDGAGITVKSDPQFVGDITGGSSGTASFNIEIANDADPGVHTLSLTLEYIYLESAEQFGSDTIRYWYRTTEETIPLSVRITKNVNLNVLDSEAMHLNVGTEGYLRLTMGNDGSEHAKNAVAVISQSGDSPVVPTDGSIYIGDFGPGTTFSGTFKASVSSDAEAQTYPLDVYISYEDEQGDAATSDTVTIGVPVGGKIDFEVNSAPAPVTPGSKTVIAVVYENTGATMVYNAQARLSAVDPFTSNDDTAYLGDIPPGDTAEARFEVTVDSTATIKTYGLDSEIRYRDALDNSLISDTIKIEIGVVPRSPVSDTLTNPIVIGLILAVVAGAAYYIHARRKQQ